MTAYSHDRIRNGDVALHTARTGTGTPVILLHGFPENWTSWRHQMGPLAAAGFMAVAPDLRGYNRSDAPAGIERYAMEHLVGDVAAVVRSASDGRAHVVGHDWGGVIAWHFAATHPELLDRLVILNAPHPSIFMKRVRRPPQLFRSWYAAFFQLPLVPEAALRAFDFAAVRRMLRTTPARADTFNDVDIDHYVRGLEGRGRLTAVLNYYRASLRYRPAGRIRTAAPALVIWGERDVALTTGLLDGLERYAPDVRIERLPAVGHWVQNEAPELVTRLLIDFLTA